MVNPSLIAREENAEKSFGPACESMSEYESEPATNPSAEPEPADEADAGAACEAPEIVPQTREPPRTLVLLPNIDADRTGPRAAAGARPNGLQSSAWRPMAIAAGTAALIAFGAGGTLLLDTRTETVAAQAQQGQDVAAALKALVVRVDALEAARAHGDDLDPHKLAADVKANAAATRDVAASLSLIGQRIDKLDRDESAKVEKLGDRFDKDSAQHLADTATRLDKLEKRLATLESAPAAPPVKPSPAAAPAKLEPTISNETTGSIDKPRPALNGFSVLDVRDGVALLQTRDGPQEVSQGDFLPGAGRIERIERRARGWTVVTSQGVIAPDPSAF